MKNIPARLHAPVSFAAMLRLLPALRTWASAIRQRRRRLLRSAWGRPGDGTGWLASRLFDLTRTPDARDHVDDRTWDDLEFPRVFAQLNTSVTPLGGQCLYRQLRTYEQDAGTLARRYQVCRELERDAALREDLQLALALLEADSTAHMVDVLVQRPPARPRHPRLLIGWALGCLGVLIAAVALPALFWLWWLWAGMLAVNAVMLFIASPVLDRDIRSLLDCRRLLRVANRLDAARFAGRLPESAQLAMVRPQRRQLASQTRWLSLLEPEQLLVDVFVHMAIFAANVGFLARWIAYDRCVEAFTRHQHQWLRLYELIGAIDASIAVAGFLHRFPDHCAVTLTDEPLIALQNAYHPLMSSPVPNSLVLRERSALISGSNMTGKTAFMKVVGANIILGQTLGVCLAASATIPRSQVRSSIRGDQGIEAGRSRYFAEVQAILEFLRLAEQGRCRVFLIDEIFSGTNTVERIAAAKAVLDVLSRHAQVLATTHDVELQALLGARFERLHFREDPEVEGFFDYRLRAGPNAERNAIRVLERMGFPASIIDEALRLAGQDHGDRTDDARAMH